MHTETRGLESPNSIYKIFVPGNDRLLRPISIHGHVNHLLGHGNVLVINSCFDVDDVPAFMY